MDKARELLAAAIAALEAYEADYGEALHDDHELGRVEESRGSPSFRIRAGHLRLWAAALTPPEAVRDAVEALEPFAKLGEAIRPSRLDEHVVMGYDGIEFTAGHFRRARKVLASLRSRVPTPAPDAVAGWVLVPEEPTYDMVKAATAKLHSDPSYARSSSTARLTLKAWDAMLKARPSPPLPLESDNAGEVG